MWANDSWASAPFAGSPAVAAASLVQTSAQLVTTRELSWGDIVRKMEGKAWNKPEIAYEFSGGRTFEDRR